MSDIHSYLAERRALIDRELTKRLPQKSERPAVLHEAMRYAALADGKRLRPILCMAAAEAVAGSPDAALVPSLAIEILHTYTLIHDDLPCMDDDDIRRGNPTLHKVHGEAMALLAGDALLTLAFEWLAATQPPPPYPPNQLLLELARSAGSLGVIGGQAADIMATGTKGDADLINYIHSHKTASLIRAAVRIGGIAAGSNDEKLSALSDYGDKAGLAFQITDDILNATATTEQLGKPAGSDDAMDKATFVSVCGLEAAKLEALRLADAAVTAIEQFGTDAGRLAELVQYAVRRNA